MRRQDEPQRSSWWGLGDGVHSSFMGTLASLNRTARGSVVIVTGAPASGKTTLAKHIALDLSLHLISRDVVKERLLDAKPAVNRDDARQLGALAYEAIPTWIVESVPGGIAACFDASGMCRGGSDSYDSRQMRLRVEAATRGLGSRRAVVRPRRPRLIPRRLRQYRMTGKARGKERRAAIRV